LHHSSRKLSTAQKSGAIESLMFLKEKIDGSIKGRETVMPGDAASPTVSLESVLVTVNTSGKASAQILHLPLGDDSSPSGDNAVGI
jgi:hypothetical protein